MEKPHVLFLIDVLASTAGGAEGILLKMTRRLPRNRFRCSVATFSPDPSAVPMHQFDCPVHRFPIQHLYGWRALKAAFRLGQLIRSERYSIVHTFFPASDLLGGVVSKISGRPILISSRRDMGLLRCAAHWRAYRIFRSLFDQVHAVAEQVRSFHIEHDGLDPRKVVTIYNGVDLDQIDRAPAGPWPPEFALDDGAPVVVCVANIRPVKAIDILVRTAAVVCGEIPEARFLVIGAVQDSAYFERVTVLAGELGVAGRITFGGQRSDVPQLLKASQVFYLPSRSEGLSNAMLEAMACSTPCVATEVGGNRELVEDNASGFLIPSEDPATAAFRIVRLLRDADLRRRMGYRGRQIVAEKFSVEAMMRRLVELYDGLLTQRDGLPAAMDYRPSLERSPDYGVEN